MGKQKNPKDSHPWDYSANCFIEFKQKASNINGFSNLKN
jgi:hypothetical protein